MTVLSPTLLNDFPLQTVVTFVVALRQQTTAAHITPQAFLLKAVFLTTYTRRRPKNQTPAVTVKGLNQLEYQHKVQTILSGPVDLAV